MFVGVEAIYSRMLNYEWQIKTYYVYTTGCSHGEVRPLIGGTSNKEGAIEVCYRGDFIPVSLKGLTISEASVICKQLNLTAGKLL